MKARVYIETSVVAYLAARPSRDLVSAAHQQITQEWWETRRKTFDVVASQLVVQEATSGDRDAAGTRLAILETVELLAVTEEAVTLARILIEKGVLPQKAAGDALHIAIAVTNGVEYMITWNYRHLANATMRQAIERVCRDQGYEPVIICTPEELLEE